MNNNDTKNDIAAESDMDPIEDDANYLQDNYFMNDVNNNDVNSAEFIGDKLKKILSRRSQKSNDLESQKRQPSVTGSRRLSTASMMTSIRKGRQQTRRQSMRNNLSELERRLAEAGISPKIANAANDVSGISPLPTTRSPPPPPPPQPSPPPQLIQPIPRAQVRIPTRLPIQEETSHPNSDFDDEQASSSSTVA